MTVEGNAIRIRFGHAGDGLVAKRGGVVKGFAVSGDDQRFVEAVAVIADDSVVVRISLPPR
jgi:sialate O-acetylesterase